VPQSSLEVVDGVSDERLGILIPLPVVNNEPTTRERINALTALPKETWSDFQLRELVALLAIP